jgi:uncharacterized protein YjbI with pentapeptide repeats
MTGSYATITGMERSPWSWSRAAVVIVAPMLFSAALAMATLLLTSPNAGQLDAIRTGVLIGVLVGVAAALLLVARHVWRSERAADARELDAEERRGTEAYARAADQLGSEKAPVRLAGLYALERLAQGEPQYRQTVVNVVCSYLRMPYAPPEQAGDAVGDVAERGVRVAAQRALAAHLRPDADTFWPDIDVDLTGATLIDFRLSGCRVRAGTFDRAHFAGDIDFSGTQFGGDARFAGARFVSRKADMRAVWFAAKADFTGAGFAGDADFAGAKFGASALFGKAVFAGSADFSQAGFAGTEAGFRGAMFVGRAEFGSSWFTGDADFSSTAFSKDVVFNGVRFGSHVEALGAYFAAHCSFRGAYFAHKGDLRASRFAGNVDFADAWFGTNAMLDGARVRVDVDRKQSVWPMGWLAREPRDETEARLADREGVWGYLIRPNAPDKLVGVERGAPPNAP